MTALSNRATTRVVARHGDTSDEPGDESDDQQIDDESEHEWLLGAIDWLVIGFPLKHP